MSTIFNKLVTVNAPDKDVVFDGCTFNGAVVVSACKSLTLKNCRFEGFVPEAANAHVVDAPVACELVIENCYFGKNEGTESAYVAGVINVSTETTGRIAHNYFAEGCDTLYLDNLYYPAEELAIEVGPNAAEFDIEAKHFGDNPFVIGTTGYATLADAIAAVEEGGMITMRLDVPVAYGVSVPSGKNFTLDMCGHKYFAEKPGAGSSGTKTQALQLLKDSTIKIMNGTIGCTPENKDYRWESSSEIKGVAMIIQNYSNLTLENMVIDATNIAHNGKTNPCYACSNNNGTILYQNVNIITVPGDVAFDVCRYSSYTKTDVTAKEVTAELFEVSVDKNDIKEGCNLYLASGSFGRLIMETGAELATIKKQLGLEVGTPTGYGWVDQGDGTMLLTPTNA